MTDLKCEANTTDTLAAGLDGAMDPKPGAPGRARAHSLSEGRASLRSPYDYGREAAEAAQVCFMSETGPAPLAPWGIPNNRPAEPKADISAGLEYHSLSADFETRLGGALVVLTKNKMFPGDASPLALAFPEARNWRFTKEQIFDFPEVVGRVAKLRRSRSKKDWRETKPDSIKAYRKARVEDGTRARERREYKIEHPDKVAEQRTVRRSVNTKSRLSP
jgi:hypothetical protein